MRYLLALVLSCCLTLVLAADPGPVDLSRNYTYKKGSDIFKTVMYKVRCTWPTTRVGGAPFDAATETRNVKWYRRIHYSNGTTYDLSPTTQVYDPDCHYWMGLDFWYPRYDLWAVLEDTTGQTSAPSSVLEFYFE